MKKVTNLVQMEIEQDILIIGAGIAGLATSLGLHSLVLKSADSLRITGFAIGMWTNAWKALEALGVADVLRSRYMLLHGIMSTSAEFGTIVADLPYSTIDPKIDHESRCVNRHVLLETLANELPGDTIEYSSKVVKIKSIGSIIYVHLSNNSIIKTKVLIGCDGINSVVAKYLGFKEARETGRSGIRGIVNYKNRHDFEPKIMLFSGKGFKYGIIPCDDHTVYWFFCSGPFQGKKMLENPAKVKQFILSKLINIPDKFRGVCESTKLHDMVCAPLKFRHPWELLVGNIVKENICVVGDALHPMTPDLGQGGCAALEDAIVLVRNLGIAFSGKSLSRQDEQSRISRALDKFAKERKWRCFILIWTSYILGHLQQNYGFLLKFFLRDEMPKFFAGVLVVMASYHCGKLTH